MSKLAILLLIIVAAALVLCNSALAGKSNVTVTDYGLGNAYHPGDVATGYLVVANNGDTVIHNVAVTMTVYPDVLLVFPAVYHAETFSVNLPPGESKRLEYSMFIPETVQGMSTRGHYSLEADIDADSGHVTTLSGSLDIT